MKIANIFFSKMRISNIRIAVFAVLALVAGVAISRGVKTFADTPVGNFANNVRTEISVLDKVDNAEKVDYLSGENITMSARVEVTANGGVASYDNSYLLIKVPKQYLNGNPQVTTTEAVSGYEAITSDPDYYIYKAKYNSLKAGTINSINFTFKLKDPLTPAGYKPEVITELYDSQNNVLSRQKKSVNTTKGQREIYNAYKYSSIDQPYIARYADETSTAVDRESISTMGVLSYNIYAYTRNVGSSQYGNHILRKITLTDTLPEYTTLSEESKKAGWTFDEDTRVATLVKEVPENYQTSVASESIKINVSKDFPLDRFNKPLVNNANIKFEYDGFNLTKDVSKSVTPKILPIISGNAVGIYKWHGISESVPSSYIQNKTVYNADSNLKDNGDSKIYYFVRPTIRNNGTETPVRIDYIRDDLRDDNFEIESVGNYSSTQSDMKKYNIEKVEVYSIFGGVENKIGEIMQTGSPEIKVPAGISSVKFKFPEGATFPAHDNNKESYNPIHFRIRIRAKNRDAVLNRMPLDASSIYTTSNEATISTPNGNATTTDHIYMYRKAELVTNSISSSGSPIARSQDISSFSQKITTINGSYNNNDDIMNLPGKKLIYLMPKEIEFGSKAKSCVANGTCRLVENYKGTGKKAVIFDNVTADAMKYYAPNNLFAVGESTPNGAYDIELVTIWDQNNLNYGDASDDLDFHDDGNTTSKNVARSTASILVQKPEQVAIKKFVKNTRIGGSYTSRDGDFRPTDLIDWRISVINISDRPLNVSRALEVLPYENDKRIVAGNNGALENRGTTARSVLVGPVPEVNGFTISYSIDAPGANETESWNKNFVPAAQITDWSAVRMIKIVQNPGHAVAPQTIVNFEIQSRIDANAPDNSFARNTTAVSINGGTGLVESSIVEAGIQHDAMVRGIAFEDKNGNNVYDDGVDTPIANRKMYLVKNNTTRDKIGEIMTGSNGEYSISTRIFGTEFVVQTEDPALSNKVMVTPKNETSLTANNSSNFPTAVTNGKVESYPFRFQVGGQKLAIRNIGVIDARATIKVRYILEDGTEIKTTVVVKDNEPFNIDNPGNYDVTPLRDKKITTPDGLVYEFSKQKANDPPQSGTVKAGETVITYIYRPKLGRVNVEYVIEDTYEKLKDRNLVPENQVGAKYDALNRIWVRTETVNGKQVKITEPAPKEIVGEDGITYVYKKVKVDEEEENVVPATGVVTEDSLRTVFLEYAPKPGGAVKAQFFNEAGISIKANEVVKATGTPVGTQYSSTPPAEITHGGITYVYKELKNDSAAQNGSVAEGEKIVKYVYAPKKGGQVIANYVVEDASQPNGVRGIKDTKVVSATNTPVGTPYNDEPPAEIEKDGLVYTYQKIRSGSKTGNVTEGTQEIVYQYAPKIGGDVKVKFVDQNGNELKDEEVLAKSKQVGTKYNASKPISITKDNLVYDFVEHRATSAPENGSVVAGEQTVVYVYAPRKGGEVNAKFVDEKGNELKDSEVVQPKDTQVGTDYDAKNPNEIEKDGLVYTFKKVDETSAEKTGRVKEEAQTVIFVYAPKPGGSVIAKYVDTKGNELKSMVTIFEKGAQVGTPYNSLKEQIIEANSRKYRLIEIKGGAEKGKVVEGEIEIIYVYEDITVDAPNTGFEKVAGVGSFLAFVAVAFGGISLFVTRKSKR